MIQKTRQALKAGQGFFLMGKLSFLTQPGEWYYSGSTLYVWTPNGASPNVVEVSDIVRGAQLAAKTNITFQDLEFYGQTEYGIYVSG